ncbi:hypothetical protein [Cohnella massiliensis]|uniref:hypothetical protein n=1 Tax=Cohnella massiliensis TaxID=1816691 RepID=UPI0009BA7D23|nr:hypothetical protein [Cohnella massiliensis]
MSDPFQKLVSTLETRMSGLASKAVSGVPAELGTITGGGLKLDSFNHAIPDYMVADGMATLHIPAFSLTGTMTSPVQADGTPLPGAATSQPTRFDFNETEVKEVRVNWQAGLRAGDRVLAVPVLGGSQAVVVCKVVGASG